MIGAASLRFAVAMLGLALACGGIFDVAASLKAGRIEALSASIRAGERFGIGVLERFEPEFAQATTFAMPNRVLVRGLAVIRLRQADVAVASGQASRDDADTARAEQAVRTALRVTPTDGFLWFGLAWLLKHRDGYTDEVGTALRLSYETAPHEGWVAAHRNAMTVSLLPSLPDALKARVLQEFVDLVASGYAPTAAAIVTGPGWAERDALLCNLSHVPRSKLELFANELEARDAGLRIPGFAPAHPPRPY